MRSNQGVTTLFIYTLGLKKNVNFLQIDKFQKQNQCVIEPGLSKLVVMPKKIIKLFQNSVVKFYRQTIFLFDQGNKDLKYRMPELKKTKGVSNANYKNTSKRKEIPRGILLTISRYLSDSIDAGLSRYSRIALFWRTLLSRLLKEERILKATFAALNNTENNAVTPKQSRRLKSTIKVPDGPVEPSPQDPHKKKNQLLKPTKTQENLETPRPSSLKALNGVEEQKFYTEELSRKRSFPNLKRDWDADDETPSQELPPPRKCRLSCPLPPPEFCSYELEEFRSHSQPPSVRFSSAPKQFLPESKEMGPIQSSNANKSVSVPSEASFNDLHIATTTENSENYMKVVPSGLQSYDSLKQDMPKMKALLFEPSTLKLKYDAVNAPLKIFKDEVLVQVAYSGVCGTDVFITEGKLSCGEDPIILGHEISGRVYAVGKEVDHVVPGDKIAVNAYTACSVCRYCLRGLFSGCLNEGLNNSIGISKNGGWAEFVVVKKSQVHKIPQQLELDQAALIQPLSCVLSAMSKLKILHEMDILVQGLGLTGCLWASVLHSQGFKNVVVSEKTFKRKSEFESLGTDYTVISPEDIGRYAVDLVVECTGSPHSIERSLNVLNPNGQMCFFGKPHPVSEVRCIPYEIIRKEITIVGNTGNAFHFSKAIDVANAMSQRYLNIEKLGVKTFDIENFKEAFEQKKAEEVSKIIFKLDS